MSYEEGVLETITEFFSGVMEWGGWNVVGVGFAWLVTGAILTTGLAGCVVPVIPGHLIVFFGAIAHWLMLREESGVQLWTIVVLVLMLVASQALEIISGAAGTKWFGGTKWGAVGALVGGIVGMFFGIIGIFLGPLIGAFAFEMLFAKQEVELAAKSGAGSFVGTLTGIGIKMTVGVIMVIYFLVDVLWIN